MPSGTKKRRNPRHRSSTSRYKAAVQSKDDKKAADDKKPEKPDGPEIYPMVFAGPMRRLYAFTIDFGLIMMIIYTFAPVAGGHMFSEEAVAPDLIFFFGYFIIPTIIWGRTPGKWVAGIVVVDADGRIPGPASIPREMIGKLVSYLAAGIGIFWLIFDPKRQGWHDKIAGTFVVDNPYSGGPQFMKDFFKIGEKSADSTDEEPTESKKSESNGPNDTKNDETG
ncbi:MAG: RDD family protein [Dehalococcoidia bacterium]|jgi:uncharacterized RDD family membrane protein YckC|nr:hypothetical protein [Chloroflexota bacterium]MDP6056038.1 RDD family protein [Dehalococcoidia bacterium]MDP7485728.1 RDD family protein [Dehalococcoidia bacterium]|tara:strand:+ start:746 stop:1414 length:669 start_codon:yes stop_codon:yes gene_type:complete